ncbi:CD209 antigen-like protein C [Saccostrea cucullata]|uniref:CD209 antigen-like protein C n=1 Tax=Saccostrea cuccullata TaxID=36930 RepID=UPI002ED0A5B0
MHFKTGQLLVLVILSSIPGQIYMDSTRTCKGGWASFQWSCYYFSTSKVSLKDAMSACYGMGAEMLELQNAIEEKWFDLQFRLRGYQDQVWLGASDIQQEGKFVSVSNAERLHYSHWISGQPNNSGGLEHCATYWIPKRGMNDSPCNLKFNYVCKK